MRLNVLCVQFFYTRFVIFILFLIDSTPDPIFKLSSNREQPFEYLKKSCFLSISRQIFAVPGLGSEPIPGK